MLKHSHCGIYKIVTGDGCKNRPDHPNGECELWAREGHCEGDNAFLMNQFCTPECCEITQSSTTTSTTTATTGNDISNIMILIKPTNPYQDHLDSWD